MHIDPGLRISGQDVIADVFIDRIRSDRIMLIRTAGLGLKTELLLRMLLLHKFQHLAAQLRILTFLDLEHGADRRYAENMLQRIHDFVVVVLCLGIHINAALFFLDRKLSFHLLEVFPDLMHQGVFKNIPVLALGADLRILDQKALILQCIVFSSFEV